MSKYQEIKQELKSLAKQIKNKKEEHKEAQRQNKDNLAWHVVSKFKYEFRHRHIAMSIIRGRKREEIERPASDNQPSEEYIKKLVEHYEQTLRSDS